MFKFNQVQSKICILIFISFILLRYNIVFLILTYGFPMLVMICCYTSMGRELWGSRSIGEHTERQLESMKSKKKVGFSSFDLDLPKRNFLGNFFPIKIEFSNSNSLRIKYIKLLFWKIPFHLQSRKLVCFPVIVCFENMLIIIVGVLYKASKEARPLSMQIILRHKFSFKYQYWRHWIMSIGKNRFLCFLLFFN